MAIGRFIVEALSEGFVFRWISNLWNILSHDTVRSYVGKKLDPKTLDEEQLSSWIMAQADFKTPEKRKLFLKTIRKLEAADVANGTAYIRNFRVIVATDTIQGGIISTKDKTGKVTTGRDSNYRHPGIAIINAMADMCQTEQDFILAILTTGAMQDAPIGTFDEFFNWFINWLRQAGIPFVASQLSAVSKQIGTAKRKTTKRKKDFGKLPLWKKLLTNR